VPFVDDALDDVADVVGLVGVGGNEGFERLVLALGIVAQRPHRRLLGVVGRHKAKQLAHGGDGAGVVVDGEVGHAAFGGMGDGAAEGLHRDVFVGDLLDDVGARQEHVRRVLHHDDEVRQRG
jgi:hypothetical protein